jgi:hypothetical protein
MDKLIRLTLFLVTVLAISVIGSRLVGNRQESRLEALFSGIDGTRCSPDCLLGIRLDMGYTDAVALLKNHPLLTNLTLDEYGWFHATGKGILTGMQIAVALVHENDKLTFVQVADETQNTAAFPWLSFKEAIVGLGHEVYVFGNLPDGRLFDFQDTHIEMLADFNEQQVELLRRGVDIPVNEIIIGDDSLLSVTDGKIWCGIRDCQYDPPPSHYRN